MPNEPDTFALLEAVRRDEAGARDLLWQRLYGELKKLAAGHLRGQNATLEPTALVHEIYLRLADARFESRQRRQFLALASTTMRHLLIDRARSRSAEKRAVEWVDLDFAALAQDAASADSGEVERALSALEHENPLLAQIVELRFLGGHTVEEVGRKLDLAPATVKRKWRIARAWLWHQLFGQHEPA